MEQWGLMVVLAAEQALAVVSRHEAVCTHGDIADT